MQPATLLGFRSAPDLWEAAYSSTIVVRGFGTVAARHRLLRRPIPRKVERLRHRPGLWQSDGAPLRRRLALNSQGRGGGQNPAQ